MPKLALRSKLPVLVGIGLLAGAGLTWRARLGPPPAPPRAGATSTVTGIPALECKTSAAPAAPTANPGLRKSADLGLRFLTESSKQWTKQHNCFGCHVQAVTLDALSVGLHHQYSVTSQDLAPMVAALRLGVTAGGRVTGAAFQGQAWARYDAKVAGDQTNELLRYAAELVGLQHEDGSIPDDDARLPVTGGTMQTTYQSMQTWRQAYARTADDKWLLPMRKAERYLAGRATGWTSTSDVYLQDVNFALLGLLAAGVGPSETPARKLINLLLARQNRDGGWALGTAPSADAAASDAFATGQTLYALRLAGYADGVAVIDRGTSWLVSHQQQTGEWHTVQGGQGGADKGEAMWAVLGLVAADVTSVQVAGLVDGQRAADVMPLSVSAQDNQAGGIASIELFIDDVRAAGACAAELAYTWKTAGLSDGKHTVDIVARNDRGQVSRRRYDVYSASTRLAELGTRFNEVSQTTELAFRNLATSAADAGNVELAIYAVTGDSNARAARVHSDARPGTPGAMTLAWNGRDAAGKPVARGRYLAELTFRDAAGATQRLETVFVHDTEDAQRAQYGQIEGALGLDEGAASTAANAEVELVDADGNVVQRTRSTEQGNFRFKSVPKGQYKVRAAKPGWAKQELDVTAAPATAPAKADMKMKKR